MKTYEYTLLALEEIEECIKNGVVDEDLLESAKVMEFATELRKAQLLIKVEKYNRIELVKELELVNSILERLSIALKGVDLK